MTVHRDQSIASRCLWTLILTPFALLPLALLTAAVGQVLAQHHKFTTFQPVEANVLAAETQVHHGRKRTTYSPRITYRYTVDDHVYLGKTTTMIPASGSPSWNRSFLDRYRVDQKCQAWFDASNPADAFLERRYSPGPYLALLLAMPFVLVFTCGLGGAVILMWRQAPGTPQRPYLQAANSNPAIPLAVAILWYAIGSAAVCHYVLCTNNLDDVSLYWAFLVYALLGLLPLSAYWRARAKRRTSLSG